MPEQIQAILNRILDWWKRFTRRQQVLIVSLAAVVIAAFVILWMAVSQPDWQTLVICDSAAQSAKVKNLLESNNITYDLSDDAMTYRVEGADLAEAKILLGSNDIQATGYRMEDVIDGSFTTTEADKQKRYQLYLENQLKEQLETVTMVEDAQVTLSLPDQDGTLIAAQQEAYARVILTLNSPMSAERAASLAKAIAVGLGNDTTNNIAIIDNNGNTLFAGGDDSSTSAVASANQSVREEYKQAVANDVKNVMSQTNVYDSIEVGVNLVMNFDEKEITDYHYYVEEGMAQGYLDSRTEKTTDSNSGVGGVPGTTSNDDDTTYVTDSGERTQSSTSEIYEDYLPSETITHTKPEIGTVDFGQSSISVSCATFAVYSEDDMKKSGKLEELDMTFDEFVAQNSDRIKTDVEPEFYNLVSNATGIDAENITIVAYEIPMFQYSAGSTRTITDYLEIILAILIFAMLGFVVFRSMRAPEEAPVEEEVSIEDLMASTAQEEQEELEDIGFNDKSEARILIEKFIDEKPEAAASLLRNWLNEDWG